MANYDYCEANIISIISYRKIKESFIGEISWAESPSEFYVNILEGDEWNTFLDLLDEMQSFYRKNSSKCYIAKVTVGQLVAARVDGKSRWERAYIKRIKSDDKFDIFMIDTGYVQYGVPENEIRLLRYKYARACSAQAIPVKLAFIDPIKGHWPREACSKMRKFMDQDLFIKAVSTELTKECSRYSVMIYDKHDKDGPCLVSPSLVKNGLAQFEEKSYFQKFHNN